ncbi:MAG TPA: prepilin-type N-terminal cleavage/methylation domain-containing protein [Candidatus Paceibacterota bacterium]
MNRHFSKKHNKGFTLIELLVVVSIIGLMSSVVLGSLAKSREKAQIAKAQQEFRQIGNALELYRAANGRYPPGTTLASLVQSYLTPYLKVAPRFPSFFPTITAYYMQNPAEGGQLDSTSDDYYYSCGDQSGTEPYTIYFYSNSPVIPAGIFPSFGYKYDGYYYSLGSGYRCLFIPPK